VAISLKSSDQSVLLTCCLYVHCAGDVAEDKIRYCERFIELLIDLESQLMTRRFLNSLIDDAHVLVRSRLSPLLRRREDAGLGGDGRLFRQLLERLSFYATFEIDEFEGKVLTDSEMMTRHYEQITSLQVRFVRYVQQI
jgi:intron-binding protein aquarius